MVLWHPKWCSVHSLLRKRFCCVHTLVICVCYHCHVVQLDQDTVPLQVWQECFEQQKTAIISCSCQCCSRVNQETTLQRVPQPKLKGSSWLPSCLRPAPNLSLSGMDELSKGKLVSHLFKHKFQQWSVIMAYLGVSMHLLDPPTKNNPLGKFITNTTRNMLF